MAKKARRAATKKSVRKTTSRSRKSSKKASVAVKTEPVKQDSKWHAAPLKGSFMLLALFGFFASWYIIYPVSRAFGFSSMTIFAAMFIAAIISMTKAPVAN